MGTQVERHETKVNVYKKPKEYEKDSAKLAKEGWNVSNVVERKPRSGIGRILSIGFFSLIFPPKPELVVTYTRSQLQKGFIRCFSCGTINREQKRNKDQTCTSCGVRLKA